MTVSRKVAKEAYEMDCLEFDELNSPVKPSPFKDENSGRYPGYNKQDGFSLEQPHGNPREPGYILDPIKAAQEAQRPNSISMQQLIKKIDDSNKICSLK